MKKKEKDLYSEKKQTKGRAPCTNKYQQQSADSDNIKNNSKSSNDSSGGECVDNNKE